MVPVCARYNKGSVLTSCDSLNIQMYTMVHSLKHHIMFILHCSWATYRSVHWIVYMFTLWHVLILRIIIYYWFRNAPLLCWSSKYLKWDGVVCCAARMPLHHITCVPKDSIVHTPNNIIWCYSYLLCTKE